MKILLLILCCYLIQNVDGQEDKSALSKHPLPYFRRIVEETVEDSTINVTANDMNSNLLSFLIENIREVFDKTHEVDQTFINTTSVTNLTTDVPIVSTSTTIEIIRDQVVVYDGKNLSESKNVSLILVTDFLQNNNTPGQNITIIINSNQNTDTTDLVPILMPLYEKYSYTTFSSCFISINENLRTSTEGPNKPSIEEALTPLLKNPEYFRTDRQERKNGLDTIYDKKKSNTTEIDSFDMKRSCIVCNNADDEKCNDPQNKLISASICPKVDDTCYSLHTPFGIVDRGCFNDKHNLTIYVCSCNLCNDISISEMPYIFSNKLDWIDNVIDLSRTRHLKKSVYKDMSCLSCMVNTFSKSDDMLDNANCLEGNIASLPTAQCKDNEICGVKAIKSDGYIWRGCIESPLYNYWLTLCDSDLCNYDTIASVYDTD